VEYSHGLRAQLWVHPPERFGTALQYATGSKDHNVRLRELALKKGLSLSEHSLQRKDGSEILCATEEEVYAAWGYPILPELRRPREGRPQRVSCPSHPAQRRRAARTHLSDGKLTIEDG
jgi:DNA polymerase (family 10)